MGGDFNTCIEDVDRKLQRKKRNPPESLIDLITRFDLVDTYRELHPDGKEYTWKRNRADSEETNEEEEQETRIDSFLTSREFISNKKTGIGSFREDLATDHAQIWLDTIIEEVEGNDLKLQYKFTPRYLTKRLKEIQIREKLESEEVNTELEKAHHKLMSEEGNNIRYNLNNFHRIFSESLKGFCERTFEK